MHHCIPNCHDIGNEDGGSNHAGLVLQDTGMNG